MSRTSNKIYLLNLADDMTLTPVQDADLLEIFSILRPAARASFSLLDERPVIFNESAQKIYALDQTAAYIWCCLMDGKPAEAICEDLTTHGLERVAARNYLNQALRNWFKLGLLEADWDLS